LLRLHWLLGVVVLAGIPGARFASSGSDGSQATTRFGFSGAPARYEVPDGICRVHIEAAGASGGAAGTAGAPGRGARVKASFAVAPGELLLISVGGAGGRAAGEIPGRGGWNGGGDGGAAADGADGRPGRAGSGGGGASDVRLGGSRLEQRVLVAGGGSGGGGAGIGGEPGTGGGDGGDVDGAAGLAALGSVNPAGGGGGGSRTEGGLPGRNAPDRAATAGGGSLGFGGDGASGGISGGGGGGGGLYGGGGGGAEFQWTRKPLGAGHGGGGSSLGPPEASYRTGVWGNEGDGRVTVTYDRDLDAC
jgi:hypothetical protein